jgi:thioredoxin 1
MEAKKIINEEEFNNAIENGVSLIDFNAPWCAPCRAQGPIVQQLSEQFEERAVIAEMNIDENQQTAMKLGIQSIPTLAIFKNGKEIQRFIGLQSQDALYAAIEKVLV